MTRIACCQPVLLLTTLCAVTAASPLIESEPQTVTRTNRLSQESSPYLLLHAHNPVDWYPWGPEALEKARAENKPIFLSIGYSSCYWCHVMEREVFSSESIAEYMNQHFVNIKVDREERPDIDDIYMTSLIVYQQAAGQRGGGGWPLSMFLTPDGDPIAGATYLPPEDTPDGRTGFLTVARRVDQLWTSRRDDLAGSAAMIATEVRRLTGPKIVADQVPLQVDMVDSAVEAVRSMYDPVWGGVDFRKARPDGPRFPSVPRLNLLLTVAELRADAELLKIVEHSLSAMAQGGIRDHLAGGFHRYSTDRRWHVPHFEKMLYDQAMLLQLYARAAHATGNQLYAEVAGEITDFIRSEMTLPGGGFCSALDAETNAIEGEYYVWQPDEVQTILGADRAELFRQVYGMAEPSPFEHGYVLHLPQPLDKVAETRGIPLEELQQQLQPMRSELLAARSKRERPLLDDKVLTEWNALMVQALAVSGTLPGRTDDLNLAESAADFVLTHLQDEQGQLQRSWRNDQTSGAAYLDDYAFLVSALIELHKSTDNPRWLTEAGRLMEAQIALFHDAELSTFFFTSHNHEKLMARTSTIFDSVSESGNSVTIRNLLALAKLQEKPEYKALAQQVLQRHGKALQDTPGACSGLAVALHEWLMTQQQTGSIESDSSSTTVSLAVADNCEEQDQATTQEAADKDAAQEDPAEQQVVFKPVFPDPASPNPFAQRDEERPVKAKIYPMFDKLERGGKCPVAIELTIADKWHVNANPANPDFLVATEVKITCRQKVKLSKIKYPKHELMMAKGSPTPYHVYGKKVIIYGLLEIDPAELAEKAEITIEIKYQACNETECLPPDTITMKGKLPLANPGSDIKRINADKFPKPKKDSPPKPENR
jgi:uncharacterized protein YyaL (SSP411 family)